MTTAHWRASELEVLERKPFWMRHVVILGRSVSVTVLLLVLAVVTALAGWLGTELLATVEIVGGSDPYEDGVAIVIGGGSGTLANDVAPVQGLTVTVNSFSGNLLDASISNASPGDSIAVQLDITADAGNTASLYLGDAPASPWPDVALSFDGSAMVCGDSIAAGFSDQVKIVFAITDIDPGETLAATALALPFTEAVPGC